MDIELYAALIDSIEYALDEADSAAKESKVRFSGTDVFRRVRARIDRTEKAYRTKSVCENPYNTRYLLVL